MSAYYNEIDPYAAQWLRNLIAAGHIAPGVVDERSIEDVGPSDLAGFTQCHFFAGIGVWSHALRRAGWDDSRPVWTGSCPCQPFSSAGKGDGFADQRHLWPHWFHLISQCQPAVVFGEQVASKDTGPWLDLVHADMEGLGYAFGAVPFPSASVGAPHIRDRLFWVADSDSSTGRKGCADIRGRADRGDAQPWTGSGGGGGVLDRLADNNGERLGASRGCGAGHQDVEQCGGAGGLEHPGHHHDTGEGQASSAGQSQADRPSDQPGGLGHHHRQGLPARERAPVVATGRRAAEQPGSSLGAGPGPTNGFWRDADWLLCRDEKWRPVEPGTFPMAHGAASRVGRLRAYGNAINAIQAQVFIDSFVNI